MAKRYKGLEYVSENESFVVASNDRLFQLHTDLEVMGLESIQELRDLLTEVLQDNGVETKPQLMTPSGPVGTAPKKSFMIAEMF